MRFCINVTITVRIGPLLYSYHALCLNLCDNNLVAKQKVDDIDSGHHDITLSCVDGISSVYKIKSKNTIYKHNAELQGTAPDANQKVCCYEQIHECWPFLKMVPETDFQKANVCCFLGVFSHRTYLSTIMFL